MIEFKEFSEEVEKYFKDFPCYLGISHYPLMDGTNNSPYVLPILFENIDDVGGRVAVHVSISNSEMKLSKDRSELIKARVRNALSCLLKNTNSLELRSALSSSLKEFS